MDISFLSMVADYQEQLIIQQSVNQELLFGSDDDTSSEESLGISFWGNKE